MPGTSAVMPSVSIIAKPYLLLIPFFLDTIIFLEDCSYKDMRTAFVEYIHQVI